DQLYGLAGNYSLFQTGYLWTDHIFMGDGTEYSPYYTKLSGSSGGPYRVWSWDLSYLEKEGGTTTNWSPAWNAIYSCNTVLENMDKVVQTTPEIRKQVEGESLFTRAYFHFLLLVNHSLWSDDAPGIGYRTSTEPQGIPERQTVSYTLGKIYEDLDNAEKLLK